MRLQPGPLREWGLGLVAGVFAAAVPAVAGTPGESCVAIADDAERLACFDREIGSMARGPAGQAKSPLAHSADQGVPAVAPSAAPAPSLLDAAWGFAPDAREAYVRLYQPNYLLFARYTDDVNNAPYQPLFDAFAEEGDFDAVEAKFQLSFKGRLLTTDDRRWGLWFAYTQQSQWQLYSEDISRPFRETNYMPELFGSYRPGVELGSFRWSVLNFGYTHQS
ncbi:MAG TPA: phospholipase A, partial [Steroidobacteraceae bacterium]|nr:phospholipase A [Steroidobacteraceae bacterium]